MEEGKCKGEGEGYSTVKQCGTMIDNQWEPMLYCNAGCRLVGGGGGGMKVGGGGRGKM